MASVDQATAGWVLDATLNAQGEVWGSLRRTDDAGVAFELSARMLYDTALALPAFASEESWTGAAQVASPAQLEIAGQSVTVELTACFYGGFMGIETAYEPPAWRFQLRAASPIGAGELSLTVDAERVVDGLDQPPRPAPSEVFPDCWRSTVEALGAGDLAALEAGALVSAMRALLERREALAQRHVDRLVAIETTPEGGEAARTSWGPDTSVVTAAARPGSRLEVAFVLEREVETARLSGIDRGRAAASGRRVELHPRGDDGSREVVHGETGADGACRLSFDVAGPAAIPFKVALSSSPADAVEGEIRLRFGRALEASLDAGVYERAPLPAQLDAESLARVAAQDLCRAHDPDHDVFRGWRGAQALRAERVGRVEAELLGGVDLEPHEGDWPSAVQSWRLFSRSPVATSNPPRADELERAGELERPAWDAAMADAVLALLEEGEHGHAAERAEELAWCLERYLSPASYVVSKAHVGQAADPDAHATRALAAYALARAARALGRPELAVAGGRNISALLDDNAVELSLRARVRLATALAECAAAGATDLAARARSLGQRALELLTQRGQERDLEQTLELLAHAQGRLPR